MASRALLVDGDRDEAALLGSYLAQHGFAVEHAHDLRRALASLDRTAFDAVLVDASTPSLDPSRVLRRVRERRATAAVVIADAQATLGPDFDAMADEWLRRPWVLSDALARVQLALARRALVIATQHVIAGEFVFDIGERHVRYAGRALDLTALEFDLLVALARAVGSAVPRDQLRAIVSSRRPAGNDRALDVHVCHLRAKLRAASVSENPIHTIRGVGYALVPAPRQRTSSRG
jgi:DNA-binding response OmpR family regulator